MDCRDMFVLCGRRQAKREMDVCFMSTARKELD
jgi:hypothetical protein